MTRNRKQKIIKTVALLAVLYFFLPSHSAQAIAPLVIYGAISLVAALGLAAPTGFAAIVNSIFLLIFSIIGNLTVIFAKALDYAVFVRPGANLLIVSETWKILRDFSNMFFIVLLVYMAFATIFDQGGYSIKNKNLLVKFIIVAVFINFSLVIGNLIIDVCQVLANIFLGAIGNLGDRLGTYLNPSLLLPTADGAGANLISLIFAIILGGIFMFSLLVALIFAVIRVPFIWALLILSPLAWMAHILPNGEQWWKRWWSEFWGWNLFLPVYLFFMYLGLLFLSKRDQIIGAVIQANTAGVADPANAPLFDGLADSLSFNLLFFYIFAAVIMVGGTWAAKSVTSMAGSGFEKGLGWARGLVKRTPLPYIGNLQGAENAYGARKKQFQQEGFKSPWLNKVYSGANAQTRADTKAGQIFGVSGSDSKIQKDFVTQVGKNYANFEDQYDTGRLSIKQLRDRVKATKANSAEGYAYRKLALNKGALDDTEFKNTLATLQNNPYAVQDIIKTAQGAKFAGLSNVKDVALDASLTSPGMVAAKRNMLMHISEDAKSASSFTDIELQRAMTELGTYDSPEAKKFFKNMSKFRPDLTIDYHLNPANGTGNTKTSNDLWDGAINADAKEIISMPMPVWGRPEFHQSMIRKLGTPGTRSTAQQKLRNRFLTLFLTDSSGPAKEAILNTHIP